MGKSMLILLILIIMLVAAPIFGTFGEVADKPVVLSSPICSECFMKHHQNIEYQLEPSFAVPLKTAYIKSLVQESGTVIVPELAPAGAGKSNGLIIYTDEELRRINNLKEELLMPIEIEIELIPKGSVYLSSSNVQIRRFEQFGQIVVSDREIHLSGETLPPVLIPGYPVPIELSPGVFTMFN